MFKDIANQVRTWFRAQDRLTQVSLVINAICIPLVILLLK